MVREGSVMERGLSLVIESIDGDPILEQNVHYNILAIIASHMERCTATGVDSIRLYSREGREKQKGYYERIMTTLYPTFLVNTH